MNTKHDLGKIPEATIVAADIVCDVYQFRTARGVGWSKKRLVNILRTPSQGWSFMSCLA